MIDIAEIYARLAMLYAELGVSMKYEHAERAVYVTGWRAYRYALQLAETWDLIEEVRVVPELDDELREHGTGPMQYTLSANDSQRRIFL